MFCKIITCFFKSSKLHSVKLQNDIKKVPYTTHTCSQGGAIALHMCETGRTLIVL